MKITDFAIAFTILLLVFVLSTSVKVDQQSENIKLINKYNQAIQTAAQDAARSLILNESQSYEASYGSFKKIMANKDAALDSFFTTLYINFEANDRISQDLLKAYIPIIAVIDYDGYYVYAVDEYRNEENELHMEHVWMEKKPFTYVDDQGNSLFFTLDDYIIAYDQINQEWTEGFARDLRYDLDIPLLEDLQLFESVRRSTIVQAIQEDLEYYINHHNTYARRFGITYTFTLPHISQEDWHNTINDVGMLAFIQGIPLGNYRYNNYSFGGSRLIKTHNYMATTINGLPYYYRSDCSFTYRVEETFSSAKEAAAHGYFPLACKN